VGPEFKKTSPDPDSVFTTRDLGLGLFIPNEAIYYSQNGKKHIF
jgi:hypothetical protein